MRSGGRVPRQRAAVPRSSREAGWSLSRNILSTYVARIASLLASFILFPVIARHIGLTMFGVWLFVNSFTIFFALDFGMSTALVRYVAAAHIRDDPVEMSRYASSVLALLTGIGVVGAVIFVAAVATVSPTLDIPPGRTSTLVVMVVAVAVSSFLVGLPSNAYRTVIAGVQRYDVLNALTLGQAFVRVVVVVVVLVEGGDIVGLVLAEATIGVLGSLASVIACRRLVPGLRLGWAQVSPPTLRAMAPFALRVFVINVTAIVILQTDNLVIGAVLSAASVALYTGAFRLYQMCREITNCLTAPLIPDASRRGARGEELAGVLVAGTRYANALIVLMAVPLTLFAREVVVAWTGPQFAGAAPVLRVLLFGLLLNNNHLVAVALMTGVGTLSRYTRYYVWWAVTNLGLSILLAPHLGLVGVALGTTLPLLVLEPLFVRSALRTFGVPAAAFVRAALAQVLLAAVIAGAPMLGLLTVWNVDRPFEVVIWSTLWALAFLSAFAAFGLDPPERKALMARIRPLLG